MLKTTSVTCPRCLTDQNVGSDPLFSVCSTCAHEWSHPAVAPLPAAPEPMEPPSSATAGRHKRPAWGAATHICTRCHTVGHPRPAYRGSISAIGLVLLGFAALAGGMLLRPPSALSGMALLCAGILVSSIEAGRRSGPLCRTCETGPMVPLDTPAARALTSHADTETTH